MNSEIEESVTFDDFKRNLEGLGEQLKLLESGQKCKHEGNGLEDYLPGLEDTCLERLDVR